MLNYLLIADVIPDRKTPRGVDAFTYSIPSALESQIFAGTTVIIPFRSKQIIGVVKKVRSVVSIQKTIKPIQAIHPQQLWERADRLALLDWFAKTYWVSHATALHTLNRAYTKNAVFPKLLAHTSVPASGKKAEVILCNTEQSHERSLLNIIRQSSNACLIITPESHHAKIIERLCSREGLSFINLFGNTSKKLWTNAQQRALEIDSNNPIVIIGSRTALFLAFNQRVDIIIDHEHEKAHKQYEMNPRYRTGAIAEFLFQESYTNISSLHLISPTPSLVTWQHFKKGLYTLRDERDKALAAPLVIDMNHYTNDIRWLSNQAAEQIARSTKTLLFLNRIGSTAYSICTDCGKPNQERDVTCQFCKGSRLKVVKKGIRQLEKEIQHAFPSKRVIRIDSQMDTDPQTLESHIRRADIIIGTEKVLRTQTLSVVEAIIVLSVDHLLVYPHYQSQERVFQILMELHASGKPLIIQTHSAHHPIWNFVQRADNKGFLDAELSIRQLLQRPPIQPLWVARNPKTKQTQRLQTRTQVKALSADWLIDLVDD